MNLAMNFFWWVMKKLQVWHRQNENHIQLEYKYFDNLHLCLDEEFEIMEKEKNQFVNEISSQLVVQFQFKKKNFHTSIQNVTSLPFDSFPYRSNGICSDANTVDGSIQFSHPKYFIMLNSLSRVVYLERLLSFEKE